MNVCEHGDHEAPDGKRFCSKECEACELAECDHEKVSCANVCGRRPPGVKYAQFREQLMSMNPEAMYADGFEDALVGIGYRCGQQALAVYSVTKCVNVLIERDGMNYEDAMECLEHNSIAAWVGEHTPIWMYD